MRIRPVLCTAILVFTVTAAMASSVIGLSIEDQSRLSKMVVAGKVISQQGVLHPTNGIETAVQFVVTEVLQGDVKAGSTVTFYTRGGRFGKEVSDAVGEAKLHVGQEVLVFIEEVDGRLYNLGLLMGVWNLKVDPAGRTLVTRAIEDGLDVVGETAVEYGPLSLTELSRRIDVAKAQPRFDHPVLREAQEKR